ncbi:hypothetical protein L484_010275 [Morus notabilis]|uniref:QWRF motif-containing protein 2 n=1 Tax=Morus notabilis TaxID=981085 RepID=W9RRD5_9ROSA|nr:hypothetical protein L484_010275 [Morus notabilis]
MVAAFRTTLNPKTPSQGGGGGGKPQNPTRPPLLPSEPDNALPPRRSKSREVTSRYMSSSTSSLTSTTSSSSSSSNSRRCPSPLVSRTAPSTPAMTPKPSPTPAVKRSQSVERRRMATPRPSSLDLRNWSGAGGGGGGELSAAQKLLFASTRSLSVSFQGESFSYQVSKAKPAPSPSVRRGTTPERRKVAAGTPTPARGDQSENLKPTEQQRWPARLRQSNCVNRSLDYNDEKRSGSGSGGNVVRALQNSMESNAKFLKAPEPVVEVTSAIGSESQSDHVASSDSESVSSGSTTPGAHDGVGQGQRGTRGFVVPARFWQETKNRLQRPTESGHPISRTPAAVKALAVSKLVPPRKSIDSPVSSPRVVNSKGQSSPIRGEFRPASPSRAVTSVASSPLRGMSPSRVRSLVPGTPRSNLNTVPSILSFAADIRRGKAGENKILDAHVLRLLYNRLLQWQFVNARADAANSAQKLNAERSLYNAWVTIAKIRESVRAKQTELQLMRQTLKLISVLKEQMVYLEEWSLLDRDYTGSLSGAIEALRASTLRLPVIGGAKVEIQNVQDAICSAVDVMQAMASSICLLLPKVGEVNSLVGELSNVTAKEHAMLGQCKNLLSTVAALQIKIMGLYSDLPF